MARYRLTPVAKKFISFVILLLIFGLSWYIVDKTTFTEDYFGISLKNRKIEYVNDVQTDKNEQSKHVIEQKPSSIPVTTTPVTTVSMNVEKPVINVSLDEWIGWKPIIDANGGLTTQENSIFDKLGIVVNIKIINDATLSSTALIKGDLDGAGYTINRIAFLMDKFERSNTKIVVPFLCNNSSGGDGIISKNTINSVEDLVGKKIVLPRYSEAQTLIWWLLKNSALNQSQIDQIQNDMILVDTPDSAAKVFFAGKADAAATWQPYLSQAQDPNSGAKLLFSTKSANNLILDVITFRRDFYKDNLEAVSKFIEGTLLAHKNYTTEVKYIKNTMPQMADITQQDLVSMTSDATLSDFATNLKVLGAGGLANIVFSDMTDIWKTLGETVPNKNYSSIFDTTALNLLNGKFIAVETTQNVKFTDSEKDKVRNNSALLTKRITIEFNVNSAQYKNSDLAYSELRKVADQCNIADGMILQIEGNTSSEGSYELNKKLSYDRAKTVSNTLKVFGVDSTRFIIVGNGPDKPIADNKSTIGREENRRTDIFFKSL